MNIAFEAHAFSGQSVHAYPQVVAYMLAVKRACAHANYALSLITFENYQAIDLQCQSLMVPLCDIYQGGGGIAINSAINDAIGIENVNLGQSTTDVCTSALNCALVKATQMLNQHQEKLVEALLIKAREFESYIVKGKTCLRDASDLSYATRLNAYASSISAIKRPLLNKINLGSGPMGLGNDTSHQQAFGELALARLVELTGLALDPVDKPRGVEAGERGLAAGERGLAAGYAYVALRQDLFVLTQALELDLHVLLRLAKDLRLSASGPVHGFNEITLPALIPGSSFYKGKINPTMDETMIQLCLLSLGKLQTVKMAFEQAEMDLMVYYAMVSFCLLDVLGYLNTFIPKYIQYHVMAIT